MLKIFTPLMDDGIEGYEPIIETEMTLQQALTKVCRVSRTYCKLSRGAKETSKKIMSGDVKLIMLAKDTEPRILQLITLLAKEKGIPIISIDDRLELGRIVGVENVSAGGKIRSKGCSVAAIQDYCEQTVEASFVQAALVRGVSS